MKMVYGNFRFNVVEYISDKRTVNVTLFEFIQTSNAMNVWWKMDSRHLIVMYHWNLFIMCEGNYDNY